MNTPPQEDGRLGGFVPLSINAEDLLPTIIQPEFAPLPEINAEGGLQTDTGEAIDGSDFLVEGRTDVIRLPLGDGQSEVVNIADLSQGQLEQLQQLLQVSAPQGKLSTQGPAGVLEEGAAGTGTQLIGNLISNAFPANPNEPLQRSITDQLRTNDQQAVEAEQVETRRVSNLGLSHTDNGVGSSVFDQRLDPGFEDNYLVSAEVQMVSDSWFDTELENLNTSSRALEQQYRAATLDIESFIEANLGEDLNLPDSTLRVLIDTYKERLDTVRDSRVYYADTLRRRQEAVNNGDYSALPDNISLSDDQLEQIELEGEQRSKTESAIGDLIDTFGVSSSLPDRVVFEAVKGYINGTYRGGDLTAGDLGAVIARRNPQTGEAYLTAAQQQEARRQIADILGLEETLDGIAGVQPRSAFITDQQAQFLDAWRFGVVPEDVRTDRNIVDSVNFGSILQQSITDGEGNTAVDPTALTDPTTVGPPGGFRSFDLGDGS